jgi:NADPH-dependent glutamate synthase beta subunit-like oxidoreductase
MGAEDPPHRGFRAPRIGHRLPRECARRGSRPERRCGASESVLVIGGGNVAVDVAITACRLGAKSVTIACLESRDEMPAFPEEIEAALDEGVRLLPSWGPKKVTVAGMELVACDSVFDKEGRFAPSFDEKKVMRVEAGRIILAIGQSAELGYLGAAGEGRARQDTSR